jgi:hypothetical protein
MTMQDGIRAVHQSIVNAPTPPRWPMYVRQAKQFLRQSIEGFDERKYGFTSVVDLLRAAGKEGVLRIERDRQGAIRLFPAPTLPRSRVPSTRRSTSTRRWTLKCHLNRSSSQLRRRVVESTMPAARRCGRDRSRGAAVADAEVIGETDEDDEPQPNVPRRSSDWSRRSPDWWRR